MTFYVGQKVVCIGGYDGTQTHLGEIKPKEGEVYTVRGLMDWPHEELGIYLVEIRNPPVRTPNGLIERTMLSSFFRPVVERKTDISIFEEILRNTKAPVTDDAFHKSHDMGAR